MSWPPDRLARLRGGLDLPPDLAEVSAETVVAGWAISRLQGLICVEVRFDNFLVARGRTSLQRPDVGAALRLPKSVRPGFQFTLQLGDRYVTPDAPHALSVQLVCGDHRRTLATRRLRLETRAPRVISSGLDVGAEEAPSPTSVIKRMSGWVITDPGLSSVTVRAQGWEKRARTGLPRPDVDQLCPHADAPTSGFEVLIPLRELFSLRDQSGQVKVEIVALDVEDNEHLVASHSLQLSDTGHPLPAAEACVSRLAGPVLTPDRVSARPRILVVLHTLEVGGAQLRTMEALLSTCDVNAYEVLTGHDGDLRQQLEFQGIPVHVMSGFPGYTLEALTDNLHKAYEWAVSRQYNAVLGVTLASSAAVRLAHMLDISCALDVHESVDIAEFTGSHDLADVDQRTRLELTQHALSCADVVLFPTQPCSDLYSDLVPAHRRHVAGSGIDPVSGSRRAGGRARRRLRASLMADSDNLLLVCVGVTAPHKAQSLLLRAASQVAQRHPAFEVAFIGGVAGPYKAALEAQISKLGAENVHLVDMTLDPGPWYQAADWLICASENETLPGVVIEAMLAGVAVVASDLPGTRLLTDDGATGLLFRAGSVRDLTRALEQAVTMPDRLRRRLAEAGQRRASQQFGTAERRAWYRERLRSLALDGPPAMPAGGSQPLTQRARD